MFKIQTAFKIFENKNRIAALEDFVDFHASQEKPLAKIKMARDGDDYYDSDELEDLQQEAQEMYDGYFGEVEEDDSDYYGNIEAGNEALFLKGGRF